MNTIEIIKNSLNALDIKVWTVTERTEETAELFFVKKQLDTRRAKDTHKFRVTVYRDTQNGDKKMRGCTDTEILSSDSFFRKHLIRQLLRFFTDIKRKTLCYAMCQGHGQHIDSRIILITEYLNDLPLRLMTVIPVCQDLHDDFVIAFCIMIILMTYENVTEKMRIIRNNEAEFLIFLIHTHDLLVFMITDFYDLTFRLRIIFRGQKDYFDLVFMHRSERVRFRNVDICRLTVTIRRHAYEAEAARIRFINTGHTT